MWAHVCKADHPQHWWVNQWQKSQPDAQNYHRFYQVQCLLSWRLTGTTARSNKKELVSICFQAPASETIPTICCKSAALCCSASSLLSDDWVSNRHDTIFAQLSFIESNCDKVTFKLTWSCAFVFCKHNSNLKCSFHIAKWLHPNKWQFACWFTQIYTWCSLCF